MKSVTPQDKSYYDRGFRYLVRLRDGTTRYALTAKIARTGASKLDALALAMRTGGDGRLVCVPLAEGDGYVTPAWAKDPLPLFDAPEVLKPSPPESLVKRLRQARDAYYNGTPIMTDAAYDALEDELRRIDPEHPLLQEVGAAPAKVSAPVKVSAPAKVAAPAKVSEDVASKPRAKRSKAAPRSADQTPWETVRHAAPMGSLHKVHALDKLTSWWQGLPSLPMLIVSDKLDGLSVSCKFVDGKLVQAATRGDGETGEDITRNVKRMKGVPTDLLVSPSRQKLFSGHLRGEIIIKRDDFSKYFPGEENPRNSAAGKAKSLDGKGCEHLNVLFYQVLPDEGPLPTKWAEFEWLESQIGVETPSVYACASPLEVESVYRLYIDKERAALPYDIDGLVVEVDDNMLALEIGGGSKPDYARAYKFPHPTGEATLQSVVWQVGSSGIVAPVALFSPVVIAGATNGRASLATEGRILELDLHLGDRILVARRGEVIPRVEDVLGRGTGPKVEAPETCPSCGYVLERDGAYLKCPNLGVCPAQGKGAIEHWLDEVGVKEWGSAVEALYDQGFIKDAADLYKVQDWRLADMHLGGRRIGPANAQTMVRNLRAKMSLPLHVFVGSLGIPMMGKTMCKSLVDAGFDTLESMAGAREEDLVEIHGVGESKARAFVRGLHARRDLVAKLGLAGVHIQGASAGPLRGKSVCMTGFRDAEMASEIERQGGVVKSGVSKGLSYLVQKEPQSHSEKSEKAGKYGTPVVGIDEMWRLLGR